jgi:hypothetical protein
MLHQYGLKPKSKQIKGSLYMVKYEWKIWIHIEQKFII